MLRLSTTIATISLLVHAVLAVQDVKAFENGHSSLQLQLRKSFGERPLVNLGKRDGVIETSPSGSQYIWKLEDTYAGRTFYDDMRFFTGDDPTDGLVHYVTRERAFSQNYTYFEDDGTVIMESDMKTKLNPGEKRESVRIETMKEYNGGLFILDLKRAPWGCAVWPAYWTTSRFDWPYNGEIDILEGTHDNEHNQITWHTYEGCYLDVSQKYTGTLVDKPENGTVQCNDDKKIGRYGCSAMEWSQASYGLHFESQGGGILAMKWDEYSIAIWSFFRAAIPEDVTAGEPRPSTWGPPSAVLSNTRCNITQYFKKHVVVFDITFCGNYAGNNYNASQCPGTCAERLADPANLINATWHINSLKTYQKLPIYATVRNGAVSSQYQWVSPLLAGVTISSLLASAVAQVW
ncbi:glycoside hydrolase family 16 protein [Ephemerocybe angulata]|uniref:Glycoside hydrolase family 16 protein n=1 Tax=Ephemerocybe angulata TaxID=980116 RepID=A0A8H6HIV5_9AGAR|nr:glycoside hydrolase family 16 protein [Tulosesus angulatus]